MIVASFFAMYAAFRAPTGKGKGERPCADAAHSRAGSSHNRVEELSALLATRATLVEWTRGLRLCDTTCELRAPASSHWLSSRQIRARGCACECCRETKEPVAGETVDFLRSAVSGEGRRERLLGCRGFNKRVVRYRQ